MNLRLIRRAVVRHLKMSSLRPYEAVLQAVRARGDIWPVSQGEYIRWWRQRAQSSFDVRMETGRCAVRSDLARAVFESIPGGFLDGDSTACPQAGFSGAVRLVIDAGLARRELLAEALTREGILNFSLGESGDFFLSRELDPVLERMESSLRRGEWPGYERSIREVREAVIARLAARGLPLVRVWYHPRINGHVIRAVFSPRYDVDRAITNMPKIMRLEHRYGVTSTAYLRVSHPFYSDDDIRRLAALPYGTELALHAEFTRHAREHGSELAAARAEKAHLERVLGRPVAGVSIHGGEVLSNTNRNSYRVMAQCPFDYDTAHGPLPYYLPYRLLDDEGRLETTYRLRYHFRDIGLPFDTYAASFVQEALARLAEVLEHNGVLVLLLHPEYFGFFSYLLRPRNLLRFLSFMPTYLGRALRLGPAQAVVRARD